MTDFEPCYNCQGTGKVWYYRIDDRRYPKKCSRCKGCGVEPGLKETTNAPQS